MSDGLIKGCNLINCGYRCCEFQQSNYIVLYPGELEGANESISHLKIISDNDHEGKRAVCTASNTGTCDGGYKPMDCKSYPFFPVIENNCISTLIKGDKCPLTRSNLIVHAQWVTDAWTYMISDKKIKDWLATVKLVGYSGL